MLKIFLIHCYEVSALMLFQGGAFHKLSDIIDLEFEVLILSCSTLAA